MQWSAHWQGSLASTVRGPRSAVHPLNRYPGRQWEAYAQFFFCSSGRVFAKKSERSRIGRSAAYHFWLAVRDLRTFGFSFTGQRLVRYDELDLGDLGGLYEHVERRRPSAWCSNRRCGYYRNRVIYCVRCLSDACFDPIAVAEVR